MVNISHHWLHIFKLQNFTKKGVVTLPEGLRHHYCPACGVRCRLCSQLSHFARVSNTHHTPILNVLQNTTFNKFHHLGLTDPMLNILAVCATHFYMMTVLFQLIPLLITLVARDHHIIVPVELQFTFILSIG